MHVKWLGVLFVAAVCGILLAWFGFGSDQPDSEAPVVTASESNERAETAALSSSERRSHEGNGTPIRASADREEPTPTGESVLDGAQVADRLQPHLDKGCIDISLLQTRDLTPLEREDLHAWLDSEGHFYDQFIANRDRVTHPFGDYGTYDNEGLRAIAEGGDAKAHMALATRLRDSGAFEGARHHYRESVIHGYTEPLLRLARLDRATQDKSSLSEAERAALDRENIIENRAYIRVYYRLGGPLGEYLIGLPEVQDPDDSESIPFDHTEADIPEIQARADEIYSEIMNDRRSRGIPVDSNQTSAVETMLREDLRLFLAAMERGLVRCDSED